MEKDAVNLRGQRRGKLSGGNSRTWDSDDQEGRLCKDCGGSDLKEEGVMDEESRGSSRIEKGNLNVAISFSLFSRTPLAILPFAGLMGIRFNSRVGS